MRRFIVVSVFSVFLLVPLVASAHTSELCYSKNDDGSVTMWAKSQHFNWWPNPPTVGGLIVDGATYPFSEIRHRSELPSEATCFDRCPSYFGQYAEYYQTVTLDNIQYGEHAVSTTRTSIIEYPDYCVANSRATFGTCSDQDGDGVCSSNDNCPDISNPNQANLDNDGVGDACDICPRDPKNDADGDTVCGNVDYCAATDANSKVPTRRLGVNHFVYDGGERFKTQQPHGRGKGPQATFYIQDTAGCSCAQIIDTLGVGKGHEKFGCSLGVMRDWVDLLERGQVN